MSTHLDFFADFAVSGEVCGAGLGTEPGAWVDALGPQFVDNDLVENKLIRFFGFVTVTFARDGERWICESATLNYPFDGNVPEAITQRYGDFPRRVPFEEVADRLVAAGAEIHHMRRRHFASLENYFVPGGEVIFWLISPYQLEDFPELRLDDIYSVSASAGTHIVRPEDLTRYR